MGESWTGSLARGVHWLDTTGVTMSLLLQGLLSDLSLSTMLRCRLFECVSVSVWVQGGSEE